MQVHWYGGDMPRIVDPGAQKTRIAAAVWRLVASRGLDAVSLRAVATEGGISMGQVQHYFASKNDLLYAGIEYSYQLIDQLVEDRAPADTASSRTVLLTIFRLLLGEEPMMRDAIRVNLAFAARADKEHRIEQLLTQGDAEIISLGAEVIEQAQVSGEVAADIDAATESRTVFGLVQGLGTQAAVYHYAPVETREVFDHYLRRLGLTT